MGNVIKPVDLTDYSNIRDVASEYLEEESRQAETLAESTSFTLMYYAKKYDDWFLDPIVGFFIPGFGDLLSSIANLPALYVATCKLHSIKLTIVIIYLTILDLIVGAIPFAGDIVDAFFKSNKMAYRLIVGYVEHDEETIEEINRKTVQAVIVLAIIGFILYAFYTLIMKIYDWIVGLF